MATPESKIKDWLVNQFMSYYGKDIWKYAPPGGMFGQAGQADRFFLIHGVFVVIEVKAEGKEISPLQRKRLVDAAKGGAVAASMIGKDYVKLKKIFDEIDMRARINLTYLRPKLAEEVRPPE